MALSGMRGLSVFISDVRNCQNKEQERLRVDKELGNIRTKFKNEKVRVVDGLLVIPLPDGPTAHFKLTSLVLRKEIKNHGNPTSREPELVLNNFSTRLGYRVGRLIQSLFPQTPNFRGCRVVTFHNQRDFIFFRHHRYIFETKEVEQTDKEDKGKTSKQKVIARLQIFDEFNPKPVASASLAQVHAARLRNGQKVAVKIQHTHMTNTAAADHATVSLIVNTLYWLIPSFDYRWLVEEVRESLPKIKKALRGVKVEVTHRGNMRRKYRISGLTSQATRELT